MRKFGESRLVRLQCDVKPLTKRCANGTADAREIGLRGRCVKQGQSKGRGDDGETQNGFTITSITITAAASPGTSLIRRKPLPESVRCPRASFLA